MPYWTTDIGGYFGTPTEELFTRWFQFGAFCPMFRIHGQAPKELYGSQWSAAGKANMLAVDNLRYRLMPYIYSLAWKVTSAGYTIMRPLVFDFQNDTMVYGIKDQFMFGPGAAGQSRHRDGRDQPVGLSAGRHLVRLLDGIDDDGRNHGDGQRAAQPVPDPRPGRLDPPDGTDDPVRHAERRPAGDPRLRRARTRRSPSTRTRATRTTTRRASTRRSRSPGTTPPSTLTIGARTGSYTGMPATRTFNVVFVGANHGSGIGVTGTPDQVVKYDGTQAVVTAP